MKGAAVRLWVWWCLHAQFSRPVRALWPSRRRARAATDGALRRTVVAVPHTGGPPALKQLPGCTCGAFAGGEQKA